MGARHQLYLIARVVPYSSNDNKPYYRSIGGFHHQWCYGILPLKGALRMITVLKNPLNAKIVSAEVENLHRKYSRTDTKGETAIPEIPCPYTLFLAGTAFTVDLESRYVDGNTFTNNALSSHYDCWAGDNDHGLTIIDVTDPSNPAYAFLLAPEQTEFMDEPVCAEKYVRAYHPKHEPVSDSGEPDQEKEIQQLISDLNGIPLLTEDLLAEAWPARFSPTEHLGSLYPLARRQAEKENIVPNLLATVTEPVRVEETGEVGLSSLADLILAPAVLRSMEVGDTASLELLLPAKAAQIREILLKLDPFPDNGLALLSKVIDSSNNIVDLSGFSLTPAGLAAFASTLDNTRIEALILSQSSTITVEHLRSFLEIRPDINRIEILDTGISMRDMLAFLETSSNLLKRVSDVILLPDFYGRFINDVPHPGAFNVLAPGSRTYVVGDGKGDGILPITFWTPDKIIRNLVDVLGLWSSDYTQMKGMFIQACMATGSREDVVTSWAERSVTMLPQYQDPNLLAVDSWCFVTLDNRCAVMRMSSPPDSSPHKYAFARLVSMSKDLAARCEVYSFRDFLKEMEKEGRGPLPPDDVVEKMDVILAGKTTPNETRKFELPACYQPVGPWGVFTSEEVECLFETALSQDLTECW